MNIQRENKSIQGGSNNLQLMIISIDLKLFILFIFISAIARWVMQLDIDVSNKQYELLQKSYYSPKTKELSSNITKSEVFLGSPHPTINGRCILF